MTPASVASLNELPAKSTKLVVQEVYMYTELAKLLINLLLSSFFKPSSRRST